MTDDKKTSKQNTQNSLHSEKDVNEMNIQEEIKKYSQEMWQLQDPEYKKYITVDAIPTKIAESMFSNLIAIKELKARIDEINISPLQEEYWLNRARDLENQLLKLKEKL